MAGINFNDLPKSLQAKLSPFMAPGVTVENAIKTAKELGKWSAADDQKLTSLNGNANWGNNVDAFDSQKSGLYKARLVAKGESAKQKPDNSPALAMGTGAVVGGVVGFFVGGPAGAAGGAVVGGALTGMVACSSGDEIHEYNNNNNNNNQINVKYVNDFSALENAINLLIKETKNGDAVTHDKLEKLLDEIRLIKAGQDLTRTQLAAYAQQVLDALGSNNDLLQIMIESIGNNRDLLEIMIDKLTENNSEMAKIKDGLDTSNAQNAQKAQDDAAYQKKVLEILASIKSAVDQLGQLGTQVEVLVNTMINAKADIDDIKAFLQKINANTEALKDLAAFDVEVSKQILNAIKNLNIGTTDISALIEEVKANGQHLEDIKALLKTVNGNVEKGNADAEARGNRIIAAIEKLGTGVASDLNVILNKIPTDKDYSSVLNAILAKIGDVDSGNRANFKNVIDALAKIAANQKDVDLQPIMNKLDDILKAIKDHKVTVDVTGKVTCECNCGDKGKHEGIIGDLNALLG